MHMLRILLGCITVTALVGCGDTLGEQAVVGAGAGAATSAVLEGDLLTGAAVGAAANIAYCQRFPSRC